MEQVTVKLDGKLAEEYTAYAQEAGMTFEAVVTRALDKWMDETGRFVYAELVKRHKARASVA